MNRVFLIAIFSFLLLLPISHASEVTSLESDGDVGYRQVGLMWSTDIPSEEGTIFEVWISNETIIEISNATKHSLVRVGNVSNLLQPGIGEWYDDCQYSIGDENWNPVYRELDGTAVIPPGAIGVNCTLSGISSGLEIHIAVLSINPSGGSILSSSISSSSTSSDEEIIVIETSPYIFAIGSIALSIFILLFVLRWMDYREGRTTSRFAHLYIAPAILALSVLTFYPVLYGIWLSFTNADQSHLGDQSIIGFDNFITVISTSGFLRVTGFTLVWSVVNVVAHIGFGLLLAIALNSNDLRGRSAYRTALLLPWAIPSYISVLVWRGLYEPTGALNDFLGTDLNLLADPNGAKIVVILVNIWLGIPFMMMSISGALQALPKDMYEAAEVDGISNFSRFRYLTLPNLKSALVPLSLLGFIWTFNMFNVIYLMTDGGPNLDFDGPGSTDILITYVYDVAFRDGAYGVAAAWSVVIFLMLVVFSWTYMKKTNATEAVT
tara:strand:+ start:145 stop:1623 length:1479 start_codon:yes stop_codon:yes gene_type:complete